MSHMQRKAASFFETLRTQGLSVTYQDVRLKTGHTSGNPQDISLATRFSRHVPLLSPFVSAAMDRVTEDAMAIAMARAGGLGVVHRGLSAEAQAAQVRRVKHSVHARIDHPVTVRANQTVREVLVESRAKGYAFETFPVVDTEHKLVGLLTHNDVVFCTPETTVEKAMTGLAHLVTAPSGTTIEEADALMRREKKGRLPLVDTHGILTGLYVHTDVARTLSHTKQIINVDTEGQLRVGAAIAPFVGDLERVELLVKAGVDVLVIDTAHGDTTEVLELVRMLKKEYASVDVVAGNISEAESAKRLVDAGADGIKVGQGPGSICTTRVVAGIGCPQVTALWEVSEALRGSDVPICADGGIENDGDVPVALAAGADSVMLGSMLAGSEEAPGEKVTVKGVPMKQYRGMGSLAALTESAASRARYMQSENSVLLAEGVEALVPYRGGVTDVVLRMAAATRKGMWYAGKTDIATLHDEADFRYYSAGAQAESRPHGVQVVPDRVGPAGGAQ